MFSEFFLRFSNFNSIFNILQKKVTHLADVFLNMRTPKNVLR